MKITPLGGQDGEFCRLDRAMIFEDPDDPRLGKIDAILVSHMHGDHIGDRHTSAPNTNTVNIALAKNAKIVVGSKMRAFFREKLRTLGGNPKNSVLVRFGATKMVGGVEIPTVPALHSNGVNPAFIGGEMGKAMKAAGIAGYAGQATGYILQFTNGLVVYLSGDTSMTAEQDAVVRGYYHAEVVVMNIGDTFTTGPKEAAFVINTMIRPKSVIVSHANEPATKGGKIIAGTRTATFKKAVRAPVHLPLSGKTMEFDRSGKCVAVCTPPL